MNRQPAVNRAVTRLLAGLLLLCLSIPAGGGRPVFARSLRFAGVPVPAFTRLTTAGYRADTGELVVAGPADGSWPGLDRAGVNEHLLLTLRAAYANPIEWPGVTIEFAPWPGRPAVPPGYLPVYNFGGTQNTRHGQVTFEADRLLKAYSLGRDNVTGQLVTSSVPCYQSVLDRISTLQQVNYQPGPVDPQRFFFEPDVTLQTSADGASVLLDQSRMVLKWAYIPPNTAKRTDNSDAAAQDFVDCFNSHYDGFAAEQSARGNHALRELQLLGDIAAVVQWLQEKELDSAHGRLAGVHYDWLNAQAGAVVATTATYTMTPAITVSRTVPVDQGVVTQSIYGGVDLQPTRVSTVSAVPAQKISGVLSSRPPLALEWVAAGQACPASAGRLPLDCVVVARVYVFSTSPLRDGDFDGAPAGVWSESGRFSIIDLENKYAYLAGYDDALDTLTQKGVLPPSPDAPNAAAAVPNLRLTLDWAVTTSDTDPADGDVFHVRLREADGDLIATVFTRSNLSQPQSLWQTFSLDVSGLLQPYLGQEIMLSFEAATDGAQPTSFFVDNVFLDTDVLPQAPAAPLNQRLFLPAITKAGTGSQALASAAPAPGRSATSARLPALRLPASAAP